MHGPTFMANPLACAAANASLDLFEQEPLLKKVEHIEEVLRAELVQCRGAEGVKDVRVKGAIGVVQREMTAADITRFRALAVENGVWLRPFGDVIYVMPPFTVTDEELGRITGVIRGILYESGK